MKVLSTKWTEPKLVINVKLVNNTEPRYMRTD